MKRNRSTRNIPSYDEYASALAYRQGQAAFHDGRTQDYCPYLRGSGDKRTKWFTGYLDARNARLLNLNPPPLRQGDTK